MKRVIVFFIGMMLLITECYAINYREKARKLKFSNGEILEEYVVNQIKMGEIYSLNENNPYFDKALLYKLKYETDRDICWLLRKSKTILPENIGEINWNIENKKFLVASNENIIVKIATIKNEGYVESEEIAVIDKKTDTVIPEEILESVSEFYKMAKNNNYPESEKFDEEDMLKKSLTQVVYYENGRVQLISGSFFVQKYMHDRSYIKDIDKDLEDMDKKLDENLEELTLKSMIDEAGKIEYLILTEKLNKNITDDEKKQIEKLEKKATKVFNKLTGKLRNAMKKDYDELEGK
ncbi:hypothetical protein [Fusobacterium sp.]|uniref:hypothetical protein n=1 Tax=Fusobacterium sp. TaxID=68766 RepID=UPI002616497C|nr:hypothetical protein [Fusobacterium sp.]